MLAATPNPAPAASSTQSEPTRLRAVKGTEAHAPHLTRTPLSTMALTDQSALDLRETMRRAEGPVMLAAAGARVFDIRGCRGLVLLPGAGATVTYSRVDTLGAEAHDADTDATTAVEVFLDDWSFYRVSTAGGPCRCCVV
jgi:hypothetical protein